jgi:hypothetical protein
MVATKAKASKKDVLREEIRKAGFNVIFQEDGNLICKKA